MCWPVLTRRRRRLHAIVVSFTREETIRNEVAENRLLVAAGGACRYRHGASDNLAIFGLGAFDFCRRGTRVSRDIGPER